MKTTLHHRQTTLPKPKKKVLKKDGIDQTKTVKTQTSMKKTKEKPRVNKKNGEITLRKAEEIPLQCYRKKDFYCDIYKSLSMSQNVILMSKV